MFGENSSKQLLPAIWLASATLIGSKYNLGHRDDQRFSSKIGLPLKCLHSYLACISPTYLLWSI